MPELPEVENRLLYLRRTALRQVIVGVKVTAAGIIKGSGAGGNGNRRCAAALVRGLRGRRMIEAYRRGKYLVITLDNGRALILHFGMGGDLVYYRSPSDRPKYTRVELLLAGGWRLAFTCPRNICRVMLVDRASDVPGLKSMGPEPLSSQFTLDYLTLLINRSPERLIKPLLMDQKKVAGIGNVYADQILHEAGILPYRRAASLTAEELKRVLAATRRVLRRATRTAGEAEFPAGFLISLRAEGKACRRCSSLIEKLRIAGRSAYYCRRCQK